MHNRKEARETMLFHMPFGRKMSTANTKPSDDWIEDYLEDEDDEDDDDIDNDEDDYPYLVFNPLEGLFDDNDDSERIDASDAAYIWMSRGKDDDYAFGYSDDELENS